MKILVNIFFLIGILGSFGLYYLFPDLEVAPFFMITVIAVSIISIIINIMWLDKRNYKWPLIVSLILVIALYVFMGIYVYSIGEFYEDIFAQIKSKLLGVEVAEEVQVLPTEIELYATEEYKLYYNIEDKLIYLKKKIGESYKTYTFSTLILDEDETKNLKEKYNGAKDIKNDVVVRILAIINSTDDEESIVTPYIELQDGYYKIEGNEVVLNEISFDIFKENNIFTEKLLTIRGTVTDDKTGKSLIGDIETYYTDKDGLYIFNGRKVYRDLYICNDSNKKTTAEKAKEYNEYLGKLNTKNNERYIEKTVKIGDNSVIPEIHMFYYNNLETIEFIELCYSNKKETLFIKENGIKFKFENIESFFEN